MEIDERAEGLEGQSHLTPCPIMYGRRVFFLLFGTGLFCARFATGVGKRSLPWKMGDWEMGVQRGEWGFNVGHGGCSASGWSRRTRGCGGSWRASGTSAARPRTSLRSRSQPRAARVGVWDCGLSDCVRGRGVAGLRG
eukprot:863107-Rhodomonas_salina.1